MIDYVTFKQVEDDIYELTAHLKGNRQWGFYGDYDGTFLNLHVKRQPKLSLGSEQALTGLRNLSIDPGHGGKETGALGCNGSFEKAANLAIGLNAAEKLTRQGATVF